MKMLVNPVVFPGLKETAKAKVVKDSFLNKALSAKVILKVVSQVTGITEQIVMSNTREHEIVRARVAYHAVCRNMLGLGYKTIAKVSVRNYSTIQANLKTHNSWMKTYPDYASLFRKIFIECSKYLIDDL